jgi:hypothetical protein
MRCLFELNASGGQADQNLALVTKEAGRGNLSVQSLSRDHKWPPDRCCFRALSRGIRRVISVIQVGRAAFWCKKAPTVRGSAALGVADLVSAAGIASRGVV